jgi:hypothetical protein
VHNITQLPMLTRISLNYKELKIGHFRSRPESALGAGALPVSASLDSIT